MYAHCVGRHGCCSHCSMPVSRPRLPTTSGCANSANRITATLSGFTANASMRRTRSDEKATMKSLWCRRCRCGYPVGTHGVGAPCPECGRRGQARPFLALSFGARIALAAAIASPAILFAIGGVAADSVPDRYVWLSAPAGLVWIGVSVPIAASLVMSRERAAGRAEGRLAAFLLAGVLSSVANILLVAAFYVAWIVLGAIRMWFGP